MEHKEVCLMLNGKQNIKLRNGSLKFQNYFKQLAVSFKIYADFEPVLKGIKKDGGSNASYTKKYQEHIPCSFAYKVVCIDDRFSKSIVILQRKKNAVSKFIKAILKEYRYRKKVIKNHFNKTFVLTVDDKRSFKSSNKC